MRRRSLSYRECVNSEQSMSSFGKRMLYLQGIIPWGCGRPWRSEHCKYSRAGGRSSYGSDHLGRIQSCNLKLVISDRQLCKLTWKGCKAPTLVQRIGDVPASSVGRHYFTNQKPNFKYRGHTLSLQPSPQYHSLPLLSRSR